MIRQLEPHEIVKPGDLVTIGDTPDTGYRELRGITGYGAGHYAYPIYRRTKFLVLGHAGHGKTTACKLLEERFGVKTMGSSKAALPFIAPAWRAAIGSEESDLSLYERKAEHRILLKELILLYNTPDKTALSQLVLSLADGYDGMRSKQEFKESRSLFDRIFWVENPRQPLDESMDIEFDEGMEIIPNYGSLDDLRDVIWSL